MLQLTVCGFSLTRITPSCDYYAMPAEHNDDKSAETNIAALSKTALVRHQQNQLLQDREVCQSLLREQPQIHNRIAGLARCADQHV